MEPLSFQRIVSQVRMDLLPPSFPRYTHDVYSMHRRRRSILWLPQRIFPSAWSSWEWDTRIFRWVFFLFPLIFSHSLFLLSEQHVTHSCNVMYRPLCWNCRVHRPRTVWKNSPLPLRYPNRKELYRISTTAP